MLNACISQVCFGNIAYNIALLWHYISVLSVGYYIQELRSELTCLLTYLP